MKPLQDLHLTQEDEGIWADVIERGATGPFGMCNLFHASEEADRRDAELMYRIEICRQWEREHPDDFAEYIGWGFVHAMIDSLIEDEGTSCIRFADSDITYCA